MKMKRIGVIFVMSAVILLNACKTMEKPNYVDEITAIIDQEGADPWVCQYDGSYYYTKTTGNSIVLYRSGCLSDLAAGEMETVFEADNELDSFWAPELHCLDGRWYIYFAACTYDSDIHRMYVLSSSSEDPLHGEWECGEVRGMDDKFAIDGTVLRTEKGDYFIWSGWKGYENVRQDLYIAKMVSPTEVKQEKIMISKPEYEWEKHGEPLVNEGPQVIVKNGMVNLVYSASGSWTNDYCLGIMTAPVDGELCSPDVWEKQQEPVFASGNQVFGPGHCSFVSDLEEKEVYMVYHSARWDGAGWNRSVRMQTVTFDSTGILQKSEPLPANEPVPIPQGEPSRIRGTAEVFSMSEGVEIVQDEDSVSGTALAGFQERSQTAEWSVNVAEDGLYTIFIYAKLQEIMTDDDMVYVYADINGDVSEHLLYPSAYYQPVAFRREMKKGKNKITVSFETLGGTVNIDRIDLMPI